ncbi:MAG: DUF1858 domain-containing protein [Anaerolineae bacterium]
MSLEKGLAGMSIADVLQQWPQTAKVFHVHNMACVGCAVAPFCTVTEAAAEYGLSTKTLVDELLAVIGENRNNNA